MLLFVRIPPFYRSVYHLLETPGTDVVAINEGEQSLRFSDV